MGKVFVIIGKSATGKDTIYQEICERMQGILTQAVSYTTRPIRNNEKNGREYYFVSTPDYEKLRQEGKIIEERVYQTIYGMWRYFTVNDGQFDQEDKNYILILTLEAYEKIRNFFGIERVIPIYIEVETGERLQRALTREKQQQTPKYTELCRRFLADEKDFSKECMERAGIQKKYYNNDLDRCIEEIITDIKNEL